MRIPTLNNYKKCINMKNLNFELVKICDRVKGIS